MSTYKLDLHTHSQASPDGGLCRIHYERILQEGRLDYVAITDHDSITFAQEMHRTLGDKIIVGEEISSSEGDIIGLYIAEHIPKGLSAAATLKRIRDQGGLVYVPHPFERVRKGIAPTLLSVGDQIDIIETFNGRSVLSSGNKRAKLWATAHNIPGAASSDAHGWHGWGRTYSVISAAPSRAALPYLLQDATLVTRSLGLVSLLYPKLNRIKKQLAHD